MIFLTTAFVATLILITWGTFNLPKEKWQFFLVIPNFRKKTPESDSVPGINITYYGFFNALAYTSAILIFLVLSNALNIANSTALIVIFIVLGICMPASKIVAWIVEGNANRFTVGGATFVGIITLPIILLLMNKLELCEAIPVIQLLTILAITYSLGEGLGRLACLSFGCCYGSPVSSAPKFVRTLFNKFNMSFSGPCKKACYSDDLEHEKLIPVASMTAFLYTVTAFIGILLLATGHEKLSLIISIFVTHLWRFLSEFLRSDDRGKNKVSVYQIMALIGIVYVIVFATLIPEDKAISIDIDQAFINIISVKNILILQGVWLISLIYTGKSTMTTSMLSFKVKEDNI